MKMHRFSIDRQHDQSRLYALGIEKPHDSIDRPRIYKTVLRLIGAESGTKPLIVAFFFPYPRILIPLASVLHHRQTDSLHKNTNFPFVSLAQSRAPPPLAPHNQLQS